MFNDISRVLEALRKAGVKDIDSDKKKLEAIAAAEKGGGVNGSGLFKDGFTPDLIAERRSEGVPIEYILGLAPFMGRLFECTPDTLIPREDTELLTRVAFSFIEESRGNAEAAPTVIEIGTGCGNIAVTLAIMAEDASLRASDISEEAVAVARRNVKRYGLEDRVAVECGDMFEPHRGVGLEGSTDIVACNPPYIPSASLKKLDREITENEPVLALDAGTFGIDIFRRLIGGAVEFLRPGGVLTFEFGSGQEKLVERLLSKRKDYSGFRLHRYGDEFRAASAVYDPE